MAALDSVQDSCKCTQESFIRLASPELIGKSINNKIITQIDCTAELDGGFGKSDRIMFEPARAVKDNYGPEST